MKVWVIDPDLKSIVPVEFPWDGKDYGALNAKTYELGKFETFDTLRIAPRERMYLDDMGLMMPGKTRWGWRGYENPLAGIGVVFGESGEHSVSTRLPLEFFQQHVEWPI